MDGFLDIWQQVLGSTRYLTIELDTQLIYIQVLSVYAICAGDRSWRIMSQNLYKNAYPDPTHFQLESTFDSIRALKGDINKLKHSSMSFLWYWNQEAPCRDNAHPMYDGHPPISVFGISAELVNSPSFSHV